MLPFGDSGERYKIYEQLHAEMRDDLDLEVKPNSDLKMKGKSLISRKNLPGGRGIPRRFGELLPVAIHDLALYISKRRAGRLRRCRIADLGAVSLSPMII